MPGAELVLELPNDIGSIERAVAYLMDRCREVGRDQRKLAFNFRVGLTEALANAMVYGNGRDPAKRVRVEVRTRGTDLIIRVTDEGPGFDPGGVPDPRTPENLRKAGGRGLFLIRELMDEIHFNDQGNSLTMILRCGGCPGGGEAGG